MSTPNKDELLERAQALGVDVSDNPNKDELADRIAKAEAGDSASSAAESGNKVEAKAIDNDTIEHTRGGITTRSDATDLGVPMAPVKDPENYTHPGPEDALDPNARGDYSDRLREGPIVRMDPVPSSERKPEVVEESVEQPDGSTVDVSVEERKPDVVAREVAPGR